MTTSALERGAALITALIALLVLSALGLTSVLFTTTEVAVAGAFRDGQEAIYAAEAVLERVVDDLQSAADWNPMLRGLARSAFVDGPPSGPRNVGATVVDLGDETRMINGEDRPWGGNNPNWNLFAYGRLDRMAPAGTAHSEMFVMAWVADDPSENDGDPMTDGIGPGNPGSGIVSIRAAAYGPAGLRRSLEARVGRGAAGVQMLSWRELRH
jgi:PilX N-terminal